MKTISNLGAAFMAALLLTSIVYVIIAFAHMTMDFREWHTLSRLLLSVTFAWIFIKGFVQLEED